jgi:hypothetical protein
MLAAIGVKAVVGGAVVALASGGAAAAMKASHDKPANWGQQVVQTVRDCKQQRSGDPGQSQGIGHCVSAVAKQHGKDQSALRADPTPSAKATPAAVPGKHTGQQAGATQASTHGQGQTNGQSQVNGQGSGATHGQGAATSGQQTTASSHGQPSP